MHFHCKIIRELLEMINLFWLLSNFIYIYIEITSEFSILTCILDSRIVYVIQFSNFRSIHFPGQWRDVILITTRNFTSHGDIIIYYL